MLISEGKAPLASRERGYTQKKGRSGHSVDGDAE